MSGFGLGFQEIVILALGAVLAIGVAIAIFLSGSSKKED
jgi:hypothetical protein